MGRVTAIDNIPNPADSAFWPNRLAQKKLISPIKIVAISAVITPLGAS